MMHRAMTFLAAKVIRRSFTHELLNYFSVWVLHTHTKKKQELTGKSKKKQIQRNGLEKQAIMRRPLSRTKVERESERKSRQKAHD